MQVYGLVKQRLNNSDTGISDPNDAAVIRAYFAENASIWVPNTRFSARTNAQTDLMESSKSRVLEGKFYTVGTHGCALTSFDGPLSVAVCVPRTLYSCQLLSVCRCVFC